MIAQRRRRALAWVIGLALIVLHVDFWRAHSVTLHFGWFPDELAYRLFWMFLGWVFLLWICARVWKSKRDGPS